MMIEKYGGLEGSEAQRLLFDLQCVDRRPPDAALPRDINPSCNPLRLHRGDDLRFRMPDLAPSRPLSLPESSYRATGIDRGDRTSRCERSGKRVRLAREKRRYGYQRLQELGPSETRG